MTPSASRSRGNKIFVAAVAVVIGVTCAAFAVAIRADFVQRGCHRIASAEWGATPNCTDAYNAGVFAAVMVVLCLAALGWSIRRLRRD